MLRNSTYSDILSSLPYSPEDTPTHIAAQREARFVSVVRQFLTEDTLFRYTTPQHYGKLSLSTAIRNIEGNDSVNLDEMTSTQRAEYWDQFRANNKDLFACFSGVVARVLKSEEPIIVDGYKLSVRPWAGGYNLIFDPVTPVPVPEELLEF